MSWPLQVSSSTSVCNYMIFLYTSLGQNKLFFYIYFLLSKDLVSEIVIKECLLINYSEEFFSLLVSELTPHNMVRVVWLPKLGLTAEGLQEDIFAENNSSCVIEFMIPYGFFHFYI